MEKKVSVYNEQIIKELINLYPWRWKKIKYKEKEKWLTKEELPTYEQLVKLAEGFLVPFGYLFLDRLPEWERKKNKVLGYIRGIGKKEIEQQKEVLQKFVGKYDLFYEEYTDLGNKYKNLVKLLRRLEEKDVAMVVMRKGCMVESCLDILKAYIESYGSDLIVI